VKEYRAFPPLQGARGVALIASIDYDTFLRNILPQQAPGVSSLHIGNERVWLRKAGQRHGRLRYHLMAALARTLRLDVLTPVPNPGGDAAIIIEAHRLTQLRVAGLRVPRVLAQQPGGMLISDLGKSGRATITLLERLEHAALESPAALLEAWRDGLIAIGLVHARGQYLSQAFARNLVQCADGVIGYIDFEDDPGATLSLAQCQTRDWLSYLHSTATLIDSTTPEISGALWQTALTAESEEVRIRIAHAAERMHWLQRLPANRRWGRDTQRVRAAARLLGQWQQ